MTQRRFDKKWMADIEAAAMVPAGTRLEYQFVVPKTGAILRCYSVDDTYDGWLVRVDDGPTSPVIHVARYRDGGTTIVDSAIASFYAPSMLNQPEREAFMVSGRWGGAESVNPTFDTDRWPPVRRRFPLVHVYPHWSAS